jgi:hypothetical protein
MMDDDVGVGAQLEKAGSKLLDLSRTCVCEQQTGEAGRRAAAHFIGRTHFTSTLQADRGVQNRLDDAVLIRRLQT